MNTHFIVAFAIALQSVSLSALAFNDDSIELFEMANENAAGDFQLSYEQPFPQHTNDEQMSDSMAVDENDADAFSTSY